MNAHERYALPRPRFALAAVAVCVGLAATGCQYDTISSAEETDLVITIFDEQADFQTNRTFAMPDRVIDLVEILTRDGGVDAGVDGGLPEIPDNEGEFDQQLLSKVRENLLALGYEEELDPEADPPDVFVTVAAATREWLGYIYYDWWYYWGWYPYWPCCGPGWGVTYPPTAVVQYDTGAILIDMIDPDRADQGERRIPAIWSAGINGLVSGSSSTSIRSRIDRTIDQAFAQSPYLELVSSN